jgi:hypothetical protein
MSFSRRLHRLWLVALAVIVCLGTIGPLGPTSNATAQQRPDCENFLDQEDAQVAFDADPADPFGLDGNDDAAVCEQPEGDFGTPPLVSCDDLQDHPDIAEALYEHALDKYGSDRYELAACIEQGDASTDPSAGDRPNQGRQRDDPEVLDGAPPDTSPDIVIPVVSGPGQSLEARLRARFAALEAQFAAFEERAENGFGMFPDSEGEALATGQATTVVVSTAQQLIAENQRTTVSDGSPIVRAQKAKERKGDRNKVRKGKRDRLQGKPRNRR